MQNNRYLYCFIIQLFIFSSLFSQNIGIHAAQVGTWNSQEHFSPEYHYNSVAVYLINEDQIGELFDPSNLTKEERKRTGVRKFDELESLYFSLQLPNPRKEGDIIDFPLYAFDIHNSKSFSVPRNQGKIIDRITDEELNGKGLEANAKIEAIKKNQLLEVAYQISSSVNRILADQVFHNPGIAGVMQKAQNFFEDKYRGKIVSEFNIPILPSNEDFEYRLQSASIYQIKWDFQNPVKTFNSNIWSDLQHLPTVTEAKLKDKPSRLSKLKKHPYLIVLRYKSAYSLPESHKLNVEINQPYLDKRLYNLQEFRKSGNQYKSEEAFLSLLREAIDMKRNCENYRRSKDKGQEENELMLLIAQQNFELLTTYQKELNRIKLQEEDKKYFEDNYTTTYYKFFKLIDRSLFLDQQLNDIGQVPNMLTALNKIDIERLSPTEIYEYLKKLETYRRIAANVPQAEGDLFYKIRDKITQLEANLYPQVFNIAPIGEKLDRIEKINNRKKQYPLCQFCVDEANQQITQIQQSIDDERRTTLFALQNQQLKYRQCFSELQLTALQNLNNRYPNQDSLSHIEQALYSSYLEKIKNLEKIAEQFQQIEKVSIEKLPTEKLATTLVNYTGILNNFSSEACQLHHGDIIPKSMLECIGGGCKVIIP